MLSCQQACYRWEQRVPCRPSPLGLYPPHRIFHIFQSLEHGQRFTFTLFTNGFKKEEKAWKQHSFRVGKAWGRRFWRMALYALACRDRVTSQESWRMTGGRTVPVKMEEAVTLVRVQKIVIDIETDFLVHQVVSSWGDEKNPLSSFIPSSFLQMHHFLLLYRPQAIALSRVSRWKTESQHVPSDRSFVPLTFGLSTALWLQLGSTQKKHQNKKKWKKPKNSLSLGSDTGLNFADKNPEDFFEIKKRWATAWNWRCVVRHGAGYSTDPWGDLPS